MRQNVKVGSKVIGEDQPLFFVAEVGINHNGDLDTAKRLIDVAFFSGCDAVKFQKRNPEEAVPEEYKNVERETPWGVISYLEYRKRIEFGEKEYDEIARYCKAKGIMWSASCWDNSSIEFMERYKPPFVKVPSALLTHREYLKKIKDIKDKKKIPVFLSTGMSDMGLVERVVSFLGEDNMVLMHSVGTYPAKNDEVNLNVIKSYRERFRCPIGYSGHEVGLQISLAAMMLGARAIERHITLDRSMWGTDQAASVEPHGIIRLIRDIRIVERSLGTGEKRVLPSEEAVIKKLRKVNNF